MRISRIWIENFRAAKDLAVEFQSTTGLLGENNAGKSSILSALVLFFESSPRLQPDDFYARDTALTITVTIEFKDLTPEERAQFDGNLINGKLRVARVFTSGNAKDNGKFFVEAEVFDDFTQCRSIEKATEKREEYRRLQAKYLDLPNVSRAEDIDDELEKWEANHPDKLTRSLVSRFRGFKNVAAGLLREKTELVFVPAVKDTAEEISGDKTSPVKQLLNTIAKQTIENSEAFREFKRAADEQLRELTSPEKVPQLGDISSGLTEILDRYYKASSLIATWEPVSELPISYPKSDLKVNDHGFESPIEKVGHGLQRAILFSVFEFMAIDKASQTAELNNEGQLKAFKEAMSDIIIVIEEPETFQHPAKQRLFRQAFKRLCAGFNTGTGIRIQIIYTTHSPLMVDVRDFDDISVVRRDNSSSPPIVTIHHTSLNACAKLVAAACEAEPNEIEFRKALHIFTPMIAEGFFSKKVVLVEGEGDQAVLTAYYMLKDRDRMAEGIHVVHATGKRNLARPFAIFSALGIPVFAIFDNDSRESEKQDVARTKISENKLLQRLCGADAIEDWPSGCQKKFAAFDSKLEKYVRDTIGDAAFNANALRIATLNDISVGEVLKNPMAASQLIHIFTAGGTKFEFLDEIVAAVDDL